MLQLVATAVAAEAPTVTQPLDLSTVYAIGGFLITGLLILVGLLLGYLVRLFMAKQDNIAREFTALKESLPKDFVTRREWELDGKNMADAMREVKEIMRDFRTALDDGLKAIYNELKQKADK